MAKKAKLDILEIAPDESDGKTGQDDVPLEEGGDGGSKGGRPGGNFLSRAIGWVHKPLFWIILMFVAYLGSIAVILIDFYQSRDGNDLAVQSKQAVSEVQKPQIVSKAPFPEEKRDVLFEDMVVDQKDEHGNIRIVFCDVALELENNKAANTIGGDHVDVRSVIYTVLKKEKAHEGLSPEGRGRLKEKLKNELNGLFGENLVKGVYFTRYELD
jgi:flagellar basal body-associated protein FliL